MNNYFRKAFTIVELVIVIAVVAILAAVLIPTFSAVIREAKDSYIMQNDRNKSLQNYIESMLEGEKYTQPTIESEEAPRDISEMIAEDFAEEFEKWLKPEGGFARYNDYVGCAIDSQKLLACEPWSTFTLYGINMLTAIGSYKEKYSVSFEAHGEAISSMRIRLYGDIDPSSGERVCYGLKVVQSESETVTMNDKTYKKCEIKVVKIVE